MSFHFQLTSLRGGAVATQEHSDDRVLAVVRGRLRVMLEPSAARRAAPPELAWLRASDALTIPAGTAYTMQAMQDSEIYLYSERRAPELWGV
ncbi:MAG: hypothetical protein ACRD2D_02900 [Terriglobales bacterium]